MLLLVSIGLGFILPSLNLGAMRGLSKPLIPQGSSVINFVRAVRGCGGGSVAIAGRKAREVTNVGCDC